MAPPSRLEKLLGLLHAAPSEASRVAAARQLGELQRAHPRELHTLLPRLLRPLFSLEWSERRAAALALAEVAAGVHWAPQAAEEVEEEAEHVARADAAGAWLSFASFSMTTVLAAGRPLLASSGVEFDEGDELGGSARERLLRQRKVLQQQLGMESMARALEGARGGSCRDRSAVGMRAEGIEGKGVGQHSQSSARLRQKRRLPAGVRRARIAAGQGMKPDSGALVAALSRCPAPSPRTRAGAVEEILDERDVAAAPAAASSRRAAAWAGHAGDNAISRALETSGDALSARARNQARRQVRFGLRPRCMCAVCRP